MPDQPTAPWHALGVDEIVARLASDRERGLTAAEAAARLARHSENRSANSPPSRAGGSSSASFGKWWCGSCWWRR